jgi:hypothetical protein
VRLNDVVNRGYIFIHATEIVYNTLICAMLERLLGLAIYIPHQLSLLYTIASHGNGGEAAFHYGT